MEYFVQQLINGLTLGSIYGLIAIGYTMVYGIIGMINFAHGDIFMIGAFSALIGLLLLSGGGWMTGGAAILLARRDDRLVGCVQVTDLGDDLAYLGMLTVEPTLQASGLGRRLLAAVESEAIARFGARRMEMTVIHRRTELIAWYERRGYALTGETRPFPVDDPRFGLPREPLFFVVLRKRL